MNRLYPHPIIAREGWPIIGGGLALSLLVSMCCGWWSLPFWCLPYLHCSFSATLRVKFRKILKRC